MTPLITKPDEYIDELILALAGLDTHRLERLSWLLAETYMDGNTVFVCGNGGSASTASHLATDLTKLATPPGAARRLRCMALTESASTMTAIGNDLSYDEVFVEQLRAWMNSGDMVIGISTSGNSPNVLRAIEYGNQNGAFTVGITGSKDNELRRLARETVVIGSSSVQRIEDLSMIAAHLLVLLTKDICAAALTLAEGSEAATQPVSSGAAA
jgi:D-sedoheptulose 7-phosphate isomerase